MIVPLVFLIAGLVFSAPTALSSTTSSVETQVQTPETLQQYVENYFADAPIMVDIAHCESRMRQLGKDGKIFRGTVNSDDVGVMQINSDYHEAEAKAMGIDIYSLGGNLAFARYLYEREGTQPWSSSEACWGKFAKK